MSVYNGERRLRETIGSVLAQSFSDFEFIIIDDHSTDSTHQIINDFVKKDKRIISIANGNNIGLTKSLNKGIDASEGKYIARIDAADLWDKAKLEKQVKFLDENKDYVICGTQAFYIDENGNTLGHSFYSGEDREIKLNFFTREGIFFHPSIVFRSIGVKYRDFFRYNQDFDLYSRFYFKGKFYCFSEPLISSELSAKGVTSSKRYYQRRYYNIARKLFFQRGKCGKDDLDSGKLPKVKEAKLGLKFCSLSMFFMLRYIKARVSGKKSLFWLIYLFISCLIYPPFMLDYFLKIKNIIIYKKLKLKTPF